ncbi:hypothetical protein [Archangium primigenium]|uniref:hypothetical protein n=1 Tax=[Archangium] primigenium TaxID=2792470 RepID=UPI00195DDF15|nr:hypothetical protein [Archangium primigenium]MBM7116019.1 hypothetical protein [Archangium primigenium]
MPNVKFPVGTWVNIFTQDRLWGGLVETHEEDKTLVKVFYLKARKSDPSKRKMAVKYLLVPNEQLWLNKLEQAKPGYHALISKLQLGQTANPVTPYTGQEDVFFHVSSMKYIESIARNGLQPLTSIQMAVTGADAARSVDAANWKSYGQGVVGAQLGSGGSLTEGLTGPLGSSVYLAKKAHGLAIYISLRVRLGEEPLLLTVKRDKLPLPMTVDPNNAADAVRYPGVIRPECINVVKHWDDRQAAQLYELISIKQTFGETSIPEIFELEGVLVDKVLKNHTAYSEALKTTAFTLKKKQEEALLRDEFLPPEGMEDAEEVSSLDDFEARLKALRS